MQRKNIRSLSLIVCTFTYLMIGAAVFDSLESETDGRLRATLATLKKKMMKKYNFTDNHYKVLETVVIKSQPHKAGFQWKFAGAFYFATVVITTVGYGHSTPATSEGRAFCILYALCGIPLGLVMFQSIGERLNAFISYALHKIRKQLYCFRIREISPTHLITVSTTLGLSVIGLGTYVFHRFEDWSIFEAYYYCVMTLTTIGLGDYVALQTQMKLQEKPGYVVFTLLFILFGLAIFSACVNLFVLRFMATNTDQDSSDREPPKTVVLESFGSEDENGSDNENTPNGSAIFEKPFSSSIEVKEMNKQRMMVVEQRMPGRRKNPIAAFFCSTCHRKRKTSGFLGNRPISYTVRRSPTPQIGHLITPDTPENTGAVESFLLQDMQQRRISL